MRIGHALALGVAFSVLGWTGSHAQEMITPYDGPYLRLEGGWNHLSEFGANGSSNTLNFATTQDEGFIVGGAYGYRWGPWRGELNIDYRGNSVSSLNVGNVGPFPATLSTAAGGANGSINSYTFMFNGLYDLPFHFARLTPYIGAGVGFADVRMSSVGRASTTISTDDDWDFALQPMVGVRYDLTPAWSIGLEYRFLAAFDPKFNDTTGHQFGTSTYKSHSILLSIAYSFGGPAPAPAPTPAAAPAAAPPAAAAPAPVKQNFIVFFDFDKSSLTAAGRQVVAEAADYFKKNSAARISLTGYTDLAGTAQYNMGLSKRRAETVAAEMVRLGVPKDEIGVAWRGKENPRVPTPDGVREPQNRRVEVVFP